jgi:hypothetical protein
MHGLRKAYSVNEAHEKNVKVTRQSDLPFVYDIRK